MSLFPLFVFFTACVPNESPEKGDKACTDDAQNSTLDCLNTSTDTDTDTDTDTGLPSLGTLSIGLPDGNVIDLALQRSTANATFEFEPDAPPEVRELWLSLSAAESDTFQCGVDIALRGVCGPGWYAVGPDATVSLTTANCAGVDDAFEGSFAMDDGSVHLSTVSGGNTPGDFAGRELPLSLDGDLLAIGEHYRVEARFSLTTMLSGVSTTEGACTVLETDPGLDDADGDGFDNPDAGGTDCDDTAPTTYPGAYDRPNDGVDGDCDGSDRSFDGVVVPAGTTTTTNPAFTLPEAALDVVLLMDQTATMGSYLNVVDVDDIMAAMTTVTDLQFAAATVDDYGAYGSVAPFHLIQQNTSDIADVRTALNRLSTSVSGGENAWIEAAYQALSGAGYDEACDGVYGALMDVAPFHASASDPFGGAVETYDASVLGTGTLGGVGFRDLSVPVVVVVTNAMSRDPEGAYNTTPRGCPGDAHVGDVVSAASALGAWVVGMSAPNDYIPPLDQFISLAGDIGQRVDSNGDGIADDLPVYETSVSTLNHDIGNALDQIADVAITQTFDSVIVGVKSDPYGIVRSVSPATFVSVVRGDTLTFEVALTGVESATAVNTSVVFEILGDGEPLGDVAIAVEIPPTP